jgi:hypothetical protein
MRFRREAFGEKRLGRDCGLRAGLECGGVVQGEANEAYGMLRAGRCLKQFVLIM